jgi:hypothetical protein
MYVNEYGESAHELVFDVAHGKFYAGCEWSKGARAALEARNVRPMPLGHCMFVDPYGYGAVPAPGAVPCIPAADLPRVRELIVSAMRAYWDVAKRDHTWREIYPEKSDARANAITLARFIADRGLKF